MTALMCCGCQPEVFPWFRWCSECGSLYEWAKGEGWVRWEPKKRWVRSGSESERYAAPPVGGGL